jgi:2-amino-4-hydroxy-6-hydroxymethyldihydropteridine diphosphokinase
MTVSARTILLGLGANLAGPWGEPRTTLVRAVRELSAAGLVVVRSSSLYATAPVGPGRQPRYLNAVVAVEASVAPAALLRIVKRIERRAGRRLGRHWGPRPLDIDVLDHGGRLTGRPQGRRRPGRLLLPHPEMHSRAFVLLPLQEIAPSWRHPRLGVGAATLLARLGAKERSQVRLTPDPALDSVAAVCDK